MKALVSALEKHQVDFDDLALDAQDPAFIGTVEKSLLSDDEVQVLFALELIEGLSPSPWSKSLRTAFENGSVRVKQKILELAASDSGVLPDARVLKSLAAEPERVRRLPVVSALRPLTGRARAA